MGEDWQGSKKEGNVADKYKRRQGVKREVWVGSASLFIYFTQFNLTTGETHIPGHVMSYWLTCCGVFYLSVWHGIRSTSLMANVREILSAVHVCTASVKLIVSSSCRALEKAPSLRRCIYCLRSIM